MATQPASPTSAAAPPVDHSVHLPKFMPFFWIAAANLLGILSGDLLSINSRTWLILLGVSLVLWLVPLTLRRGPNLFTHRPLVSRLPPIVLVVFFLLGAWRLSASKPITSPNQASFYNDKGLVEFVGVIIQPPEVHDTHTSLVVKVEALTPLESDEPDAGKIKGQVLLQVMPGKDYHYGQRIEVRGKLQTPPDGHDFSYRDYLARRSIHSLISYAHVEVVKEKAGNPILVAIYQLRERSEDTLTAILPSPESDLLMGILLGNDRGLPDTLNDAYQVTGTAHIIAISGFNVALLAGLVTSLLSRALGKRRGTTWAVILLTFYCILVGAEAAVVRATIMGSLGMLGALLGRRNNGLNTLGITVLGMCLVNPNLPWDIGFQLSFMATLGLVLYAQPFETWLTEQLASRLKPELVERLAVPLTQYLLFTLIAQVMVLPLLAFHFRRLSWLFLVANPLVLPVQPLVMVLGGVALLGGLLFPGLGRVLGYLAWPFAAYTNRMVTWLAALAPTSLALNHFSIAWVILYYVVLFTLTFIRDWKAAWQKIAKPAALLVPLGCAVLVTWSLALGRPDGKLSLVLLPAGDNPVLLAETPGGRFMLVNGAVEPSNLRTQLSNFMPLTFRELDSLVIPSCKKDDVIGLVDLEDRISIHQVIWACDPERIQTTRQLYQSFSAAGVDQAHMSPDDRLDLGNGAFLTLQAAQDNNALFSIIWQDFSANLVIGDSTVFKTENLLNTNLLILPFKGGEMLTANGYPAAQVVWLAVDPQNAALINQTQFSPAPLCSTCLPTDVYGWLRAKTDGQQLWLTAQNVPK